jgi:hypothetical protein
MSLVTLLSVDGPVHLVKGDEPTGGAAGWLTVCLVGAVAVSAVLWWALNLHRARIGRDEQDYSFRRVARKLGLPAPMCRLIRRLAQAHGSASPVALLISEHGLRTAISAFERGTTSTGDQKQLERLKRDFGL